MNELAIVDHLLRVLSRIAIGSTVFNREGDYSLKKLELEYVMRPRGDKK